ncbi:MAG TPA: GNAT family N-acetyltransferase [Chloroflexota bacterium]|jgi:RimJ/RimL family protein N-acetyltransferase|nr:GNAT family N-acetyltransferase [Chloroflexota bacterium]
MLFVFSIDEPIITERLLLRPFTHEDLDDVYAYHSLPDVVRFLYWEVRTREETRNVLRRKCEQTSLKNDGDSLVLAITLTGCAQGTNTGVVGEVILFLRSLEHRQAEIGFVMNPDFQGKGYAREAAEAMLKIAFDDLNAHRVFGRTDARNEASSGLMRRLGMRQEAHFVHNEIFKDEWGDELIFAILEDEWVRMQLG